MPEAHVPVGLQLTNSSMGLPSLDLSAVGVGFAPLAHSTGLKGAGSVSVVGGVAEGCEGGAGMEQEDPPPLGVVLFDIVLHSSSGQRQ